MGREIGWGLPLRWVLKGTQGFEPRKGLEAKEQCEQSKKVKSVRVCVLLFFLMV